MIVLSTVIKDKKIDIETEKSSGKSRSRKKDEEDDDTTDKTMDRMEKGNFLQFVK